MNLRGEESGMNILVLHDSSEIQGWLINEPLESAEEHLRNGYQGLLAGWRDKIIKASVIDVPDEEVHRPDLYQVSNDAVVRKTP